MDTSRVPCEFATFTNPQLKAEFTALSRISCAALNCIDVDPVADPLEAFTALVSLFCIVSENSDKLELPEVESGQLEQTVQALEALPEYPEAVMYPTDEFLSRIETYVDAARKISAGQPASGNPIVELL
jgi:hypothetical protein